MKALRLILLLLALAADCCAEGLKVDFATGEWPPFTSSKLQDFGKATALVSAICKRAGIEPVYHFYPWRRAEMMVLKGRMFAAFPYAVSEERKRSYDFSDILFYGLNVVVYHADNPRIPPSFGFEIAADLEGYRIGGISGSFLARSLEKVGIKYQPTTSIDQSIHKLRAGRLDFCIDDSVVIADAIRRLYPDEVDKFIILPKTFGAKNPTALLVSRSYPGAKDLLQRFNQALAEMKESGEYDRIISQNRMAN